MVAAASLLKYDSRKHEEGKEDRQFISCEHNNPFSGSACVKPCVVDIGFLEVYE
jgi:hypothetical protein